MSYKTELASNNTDLEAILAAVNELPAAFSGSYNDLTDKPTIPDAYTHPTSHPASMITAGTFSATDVKAATDTDYTTYRIRNAAIVSATPSSMSNGDIAFVYS